MTAENFFSAQEKERIHRAVVAAESRTSGEIVPMIVGASGRYAEVEITGLIAGLLVGTLAAFRFGDPWAPVQNLLAWPLLGATVGFAMCYVPAIKRCLISNRRVDEAVHERCLAAFTAHGLHYTKAHTGILILISLLERRVQVLADRGISQKVPEDTWNEIVSLVTSGLKTDTACDAFCQAIQRCGEILAAHFPRAPDDRDELVDTLITEK